MDHSHEENPLVTQARAAFAACQAELAELEQAQADEVIEVTVRSRAGELTIRVSHEAGFQVTNTLLEEVEVRRRRLWERYLEKVEAQGFDAGIDLKNYFGS